MGIVRFGQCCSGTSLGISILIANIIYRVCKKLLLTSDEAIKHLKSKPHWDLTVKATNAKRKQVASTEDSPASKVAKT